MYQLHDVRWRDDFSQQKRRKTMTKMNIAQGLKRTKRLKGQMNELTKRAVSVVSHRADKEPPFDFAETLETRETVRKELISLTARISLANATAIIVVDGKEIHLVEGVKMLQELKDEIDFLKTLPLRDETEREPESVYDDNTGRYVQRYREIKWVSAMTEKERAEKIQSLQDRFEEVNGIVDSANYSTPI
jgi:hypothetical protein